MTSDRHVDTDPTISKIMDTTVEHRRNGVAEQAEPQAEYEHHVRPTLPHQNSASSDFKSSTASGNLCHDSASSAAHTPLSPPLPPASFNPVPDVHPLLLAATSRNPSNENAAGLQVARCSNAQGETQDIVSPVMSPIGGGSAFPLGLSTLSNLSLLRSPPLVSTPPRRYSGGSNVSASTPNTKSFQQSNPFHFAEFQTEIGTLQRRLSEERSRRSSAHSVKRIAAASDRPVNTQLPEEEHLYATHEATNKTSAISKDGPSSATHERPALKMNGSSGTTSSVESDAIAVEHLREARQELQAVLEEALEESCVNAQSMLGDAYPDLETEQDRDDLETLVHDNDFAEPTQVSDLANSASRSHLDEEKEMLDPLAPSDLLSALVTSPIPDPPSGAPISFEDLVRHQRRNSDSASNNEPRFSPGAGSSPTSPVPQPTRSRTGSTSGNFKDGLRSRSRNASISRSATASNTGSQSNTPNQIPGASQLTKMRRSFSTAKNTDKGQYPDFMLVNGTAEKNGAGERVYSPASILLAAEAAGVADSEQSRTPSPKADIQPATDSSVAGRTPQSNMPLRRADEQDAFPPHQLVELEPYLRSIDEGASKIYQWRDASHFDAQARYPAGQSESDQSTQHDTHLWDSVWPSSAATNASNASTSGLVPFPKPITNAGPGLRPRLPMHSRTMSTNYGSGSVSNDTSPTHADVDRVPMIHSLSYPRVQSSRHDSPAPLSKVPSYSSGVPLFFSSALHQGGAPSAWPQGASARRGSLASLGSWPLTKNGSISESGGAIEENEG
ncbi:hypothetical protein QFC22_005934 [Naganishia vaughanmartiniae]|uniref:Uncharacterized protein n=1 Tax=Naganishia vaughanmartiniae TaxID=1424756 RepID=A0ACC2WRA9_9TREE|nr:hypothetical protein QFC22_005934 [Naganishia vaughanmartiniae]